MRSAPTSLGLSYRMRMPLLIPAPHDERPGTEIVLGHVLERIVEIGIDARHDDAVYILNGYAVALQKVAHGQTVLVARLAGRRSEPQAVHQLVPVKDAAFDIRIAYVDGEIHTFLTLSDLLRDRRTRPRSAVPPRPRRSAAPDRLWGVFQRPAHRQHDERRQDRRQDRFGRALARISTLSTGPVKIDPPNSVIADSVAVVLITAAKKPAADTAVCSRSFAFFRRKAYRTGR